MEAVWYCVGHPDGATVYQARSDHTGAMRKSRSWLITKPVMRRQFFTRTRAPGRPRSSARAAAAPTNTPSLLRRPKGPATPAPTRAPRVSTGEGSPVRVDDDVTCKTCGKRSKSPPRGLLFLKS